MHVCVCVCFSAPVFPDHLCSEGVLVAWMNAILNMCRPLAPEPLGQNGMMMICHDMFNLSHAMLCAVYWHMGSRLLQNLAVPFWHICANVDSLISTYIAQYMGYAINRIHYGLKVVFYFRHFTVFHYHHYARLITGTEHILMSVKYLVEVCLTITCC